MRVSQDAMISYPSETRQHHIIHGYAARQLSRIAREAKDVECWADGAQRGNRVASTTHKRGARNPAWLTLLLGLDFRSNLVMEESVYILYTRTPEYSSDQLTHPPHQPRTIKLTHFSRPSIKHQSTINMIISRVVSLILRIAQFIFAAIVLGLTAYFLYQRSRYHVGPFGRVVFSVIWSSLSIIFAIIWAIPTTSSTTGYISDLGKCTSVPSSHLKLTYHQSVHCWLGCCLRSARPLVQPCWMRLCLELDWRLAQP